MPISGRSEQEIRIQLDARRREWHEGQDKLTIAKGRVIQDAIKVLQTELSACIADGARNCECGAKPFGMRRREHLYEVGCLVCPPYLVSREFKADDGTAQKAYRRVSFSAQGLTAIQAVDKWNARDYLIDDNIERVPAGVTVVHVVAE